MSGCDKFFLTGLEGIPDSQFKGVEPKLPEDVNSVGVLTDAYLHNTESLTVVNGRLFTICQAYEIEDCGPQ